MSLLSPTSRVHIKYTIESLTAHPGAGWTRFVCISDTHRKTMRVVDGDVLIHAGDFTSFTTGFRDAIDWIKGLSHPQKILIAGNHEYNLDNNVIDNVYPRDPEIRAELEEDRKILRDQSAVDANLTYLEAESANILAGRSSEKSWVVYGSPYTPEFGTMGFSYREKEADGIWAPVPEDTEILVTHGPPFGVLDIARRNGVHVGCSSLSRTVLHRLLKARLHVFGHIHEGRGAEIRKGATGQDIVFVNAACQSQKDPLPIVVDLKNDIDN